MAGDRGRLRDLRDPAGRRHDADLPSGRAGPAATGRPCVGGAPPRGGGDPSGQHRAGADLHLVSIARARIDAQPPSEFELALGPVALTLKLDARFVELREELRYSVKNFRYFDHVLWPRLVALGERLPVAADRTSTAQPQGRSFGRGPSLTAIEELLTRMEEPR